MYYIIHKKIIWNSKLFSLVKAEKLKLNAAKCMIQSFSSLIAEKFMKTIIAYRRCLKMVDDG